MGFFSAVKKFFGGKAENGEVLPENESPRASEKNEGSKRTGTEKPEIVSGEKTGLEKDVCGEENSNTELHPKEDIESASISCETGEENESPGREGTAHPRDTSPVEPDLAVPCAGHDETASRGTTLKSPDIIIEEAAIEDVSGGLKQEELREKPCDNVLAEAKNIQAQHDFQSVQTSAPEEVSGPDLSQPAIDETIVKDDSGAGANSEMLVRLREAEPRLSKWLDIILEDVQGPGDLLWERISFLLRSLDAPADETAKFVREFGKWLERMEYGHIDEFRSELQYQLALALDLEDEEDERNRLFLKLSDGLARTREQFSRQLDNLFASRGELDDSFWDELEELFIMADLGYEPAMELSARLKERARKGRITSREKIRELLHAEIEDIFKMPKKISAINPPEVVLMIGVNGVGKTTTIAKLAYRAKMQGKKVLIAAGDTFRAAAIEQLEIWAKRVGVGFFAKAPGSDPAAVAYEAVDKAIQDGVDIIFVDTAGRLQTKTNLMRELGKIRHVLAKKHPGAPHRSILVLDATTGQNALSQARLFKEAASADELILTKLDGTAKGGVAISVAMQENLPISYVGLGEKMEDLRPFNGADYAAALLGLEKSEAA